MLTMRLLRSLLLVVLRNKCPIIILFTFGVIVILSGTEQYSGRMTFSTAIGNSPGISEDTACIRWPKTSVFSGQEKLKMKCGKSKLHLCPTTPDKLKLKGEIPVNLTVPTWKELELQHNDLDSGGKWEPTDCIARHNVAIIVPYRDRETQLLLFLQHIHPFLKKQKIAYTIYLLEQLPGKVFNRGLDRNIGFLESLKLNPHHECTMFHDVDLLPLDERNMYSCPDQPRHVCVAVNYINNFIVRGKGMAVYRYPDHIGKYYGIPHADESTLPRPHSLAQNVSRFKLLNLARRRKKEDGLSSAKYNVVNITRDKLFTRIKFDVEENMYAIQGVQQSKLYHQLYGNLTQFWRRLEYIPPPYWYRDKNLTEKVRNQVTHPPRKYISNNSNNTVAKIKKVLLKH